MITFSAARPASKREARLTGDIVAAGDVSTIVAVSGGEGGRRRFCCSEYAKRIAELTKVLKRAEIHRDNDSSQLAETHVKMNNIQKRFSEALNDM